MDTPVMDKQTAGSLAAEMDRRTGRYTDKMFDWEAFPASKGYAELDRAQVRYIGAGGSHKIDDPTTLQPEHFTLSIVHQPVGKYGASHSHEVEESFTILEGILDVGWEWDGEVIEGRLGPKDMILHAIDRPHGFRNSGVDPVQVSIMVGKARPLPPKYLFHPKTHTSELSAAFGAQPGRTFKLDYHSSDPRHKKMAGNIVRYSQQRPTWDPIGFARLVYIGEGGAPAGTYRKDLVHLPRGIGVKPYERDVEESIFVIEGCVTVGWLDEKGKAIEQRLGRKDLLLTPAGQPHYFRNDSVEDAQFFMAVGSPEPDKIKFKAA